MHVQQISMTLDGIVNGVAKVGEGNATFLYVVQMIVVINDAAVVVNASLPWRAFLLKMGNL